MKNFPSRGSKTRQERAMDDLERLLSNIDSDSEADQTKDEFIRSSERLARKSDSTSDSDYDDNLESFEIKIERFKKDAAVLRFKGGYLEALKLHWNLVLDFKNILTDVSLPDPVMDALRKYKYNFIRFLENIEKLYDGFVSSKSIDDLEKKAKQDFSIFFPTDDYSTGRINFLVIKELFIRLREMNAKIKREWDSLSSSLTVIHLVNEGKDFYQKTSDYVSNGIDLCQDTDKFLEFLAAVLRIHKNDIDVLEKEIQTKIVFKPDYHYEYPRLFQPASVSEERREVSQYIDVVTDVPDVQIDQVSEKRSLSEDNHPSAAIADPGRQIGFAEFIFRIPGRSSWNRREPYIISVDHALLKRNLNDLDAMIYFTDEPKKQILIDANIKRAVIRYMRERRSIPVDQYEEFICKTLTRAFDILVEKFQLPGSYIQLFKYHCGPQTLYASLIKSFSAAGTAVCYKFISESKISRFRPDEAIKYYILKWYQQNINDLDLPFDRVQEFNVIRDIVAHHYTNDAHEAMRKVDAAAAHYQSRTGKILDKRTFVKMKAYELFIPESVEVYKRFVEKTVF